MKCIEDEIPFEVPEGWVWSRLLPLSEKIGAGSTPTGGAAVYSESGVKFIRSQNVYNDGVNGKYFPAKNGNYFPAVSGK